jgi:membrane protein CcdC involved in cytochrome C biogenesis
VERTEIFYKISKYSIFSIFKEFKRQNLAVIYPDSNVFGSQSFIVVIIIIVLLQLRERRVKPWSLMILPAFMFLITLSIIQNVFFTSLLNFSLIIAGFIIGLFIGIAVGYFMKVKVDENGNMILKGSLIAVGLWILVIITKFYGQNVLGNSGYIDFGVLSSMILMLTLGAMISRRIFIYMKFRHYKINKHGKENLNKD